MSIEKRGENKWRFKIRRDGKVYTSNFSGSEKDAKKAHKAFEADVERGYFKPSENMKLDLLINTFMQEYAYKKLAAATIKSYEYALKFLSDEFGNRPISSIKPVELQKFFNKLSKEKIQKHNSDDISALSPKTIETIYSSVRCLFNKATDWDIIDKTPCKAIELDKVNKRNLTQLYSYDQISQLIKAVTTNDIPSQRVFLTLSLFGGFRKGELLGITLDDVDFNKNCITINKQYALTKNEKNEITLGIKDKTKTENSLRKVFLPKIAMDILKDYISKMPYIPMSKQIFWNFYTNKLYTKSCFNIALDRLLLKNNLPKIRVHDLRHLNATMLINSGANIVSVAGSLGDTVKTVSSVYVHEIEEIRMADANNLEKFVCSL